MEPIYSLRDIEQHFGGRIALQIDDLDLHAGRIYSLVGANGAGKSTLLKALALLARPTRGQLFFDGRAVRWSGSALAQQRRQVTLVHQSPYLFDRTVAENLSFGLGIRGLSRPEQRQRLDWALGTVGLDGYGDRQVKGLSGGESQRVALARALALQPRVLLLDEPTSAIDSGSLAPLEGIIADLPRQGVTVIMATHDPGQPARLDSEVLHLVQGRLLTETARPAPTCIRPLPTRISHAQL